MALNQLFASAVNSLKKAFVPTTWPARLEAPLQEKNDNVLHSNNRFIVSKDDKGLVTIAKAQIWMVANSISGSPIVGKLEKNHEPVMSNASLKDALAFLDKQFPNPDCTFSKRYENWKQRVTQPDAAPTIAPFL